MRPPSLVLLCLMAFGASAQVPSPERVEQLTRDFPELRNAPDPQRADYIVDPTIRHEAAPVELERAYTEALTRLSVSEMDRSVADANLAAASKREVQRQEDVARAVTDLALAEALLQQATAIDSSGPGGAPGGTAADRARDAVARAKLALTLAKSQLSAARIERATADEAATGADTEFRRLAANEVTARNARNAALSDEFLRNCSTRGQAIQRNTILVRFANSATKSEINEIMRRNDVHLVSGMPEISLFIVELRPSPRPNETEEEHRLRLKRTIAKLTGEKPFVTSAVQQVVLHGASMSVLAITLRPCWSWFNADAIGTDSADLMRLPLAWAFLNTNRPAGGASVPVAVLDTGFVDNDDLPGVAMKCAASRGTHGSQVAGLLAGASGNHQVPAGTAPVSRLAACAVPVVPFLCAGDSAVSFVSIAFGLRDLLVNQQPRVVNLSLGYKWRETFLRIGSTDVDIQAIVNAQGAIVRDLLKQFEDEVVVVSAAGNECVKSTCTEPAIWASPVNWAALAPEIPASGVAQSPNVIVVESVDRTGTPSSFSSKGATVRAPGEDLLTCRAGISSGTERGTSFSAPIVSGIAAMMLAQNPALTPAQVVTLLRDSPGQGRITVDALTAIQSAQTTR